MIHVFATFSLHSALNCKFKVSAFHIAVNSHSANLLGVKLKTINSIGHDCYKVAIL